MSGPPSDQGGVSLWTDAARRLRKDKLAVVAFVVIVLYVLVGISSELGLFGDYNAQNPDATYASPSFTHPFGTNVFGQSVLARVAQGTSIGLRVGLFAGLIAVSIGAVLGALAGWYGKFVDESIVWLYSTVASIPGILLIVGLSYMLREFGEDWVFAAVFIAMGLTYWVGVCRIVRGEFMKLKDRDYVLAARATGMSDTHIIFSHVMPNVAHLLIISFTLLFVQAIKAEVVVSFLGVGVVGKPSWGLLIQDASVELSKGYWWQMTFTSVALFGLVLAFQVFGDALRDALDPRLRN